MLSSKNIPKKEKSNLINRLAGILGITEENKKIALISLLDDWHNKVHEYSSDEDNMDEDIKEQKQKTKKEDIMNILTNKQ